MQRYIRCIPCAIIPEHGILTEQTTMAAYPNLRARYSKGTLKLNRPLRLPDGTEVRVSVSSLSRKSKRRRAAPRPRLIPPPALVRIRGVGPLGGAPGADGEPL